MVNRDNTMTMTGGFFRRTLVAMLAMLSLTAWPTAATPPYTAIIIDSGSPYFVPKSATVSTGAPIRWENPTPTEHTVTHVGCLEDGNGCAFDSGLVLPNDTYTHPGLTPGKYQYICRIHPIMHGTIIVTDSTPVPSQL
jgi:plastocyanin